MYTDSLIARSLTWRYLIALTLVAMLTTAAWLSLHLVISEQNSNAAVVNISGRQRMLSQRTALFSTLLVSAPEETRATIRSQLQEAAGLMQRSHRGLIHGDAEMGLPDNMSATVRAMYFEPPLGLDSQVATYLATVQALLQIPDAELRPDAPQLQYIITVSPSRLVSSLDKMVGQYQREGEAAVASLQTAETIVWLVTLLLLLLEAAFIFHPFTRQIRIVIDKLQGVTASLRQHQNELEERVRQRTEELEEKSKELADSEEKFRLISTSAQDAILIIDQAEAITYWNPAASAMFAYPAEQALGRNLHDLLAPPRYRAEIKRGFAHFCRTGSGPLIGKTLEINALRNGGEEFPIELSISTLLLNGQTHALGIIRDISVRKRVEEELRASEERYSLLFDKSPLPMWVYEEGSLRFLMVNKRAIEHYGYDREEFLAMTLRDIRPAEDVPALLRATSQPERGDTFGEWRHRKKDGTVIDVDVHATSIAYGARTARVVLVQDITERKQAQEKLQQAMIFSETLIESLPGIFFRLDSDGRLVGWNKALEILLGQAGLARAQASAVSVIHEEDRLAVAHKIREGFENGFTDTEARLVLETGNAPYFYFVARSLAIGNQYCLLGTGVDIGERKSAEARLQLAASVFTHAREGITITDVDGNIVEVNDAFSRITGYSRAEALGRNPRVLKSGRQPPEYYAAMWQALLDNGYWTGEVWNRRKDGEVYAEMLTISAVRDDAGQTQNYVALFSDITPMKEHQHQLEHIAHYDALTDLPNRVLLGDRLQQAVVQSQRRNLSLAVAYLDLDGFKAVNDRHGHDVGDQLLIAVSRCMKSVLREGDTLARIGGDEFVAVLVDLEKPQDCEPVLARLLGTAAAPVMVGELVLQVSASIGATVYPLDDADTDQLLRHADQAMYQAKAAGKNRCQMFNVAQGTAVEDA